MKVCMRRRALFLVSSIGFALGGVACERASSVHATASSAPDEEEPGAVAGLPKDALAAVARAPFRVASGPCPEGMILVEGDYCPNVELDCKRYLDPPGRYGQFRCAEYGPSQCRSKTRERMRYCIDQHEYVPPKEVLPANYRSFSHAEKTCAELGKRVCLESEWNFACEGEEMRPYPYGFTRDAEACNADRQDIIGSDGKLRDLRAPPGAHPRCASPFGVLDLAGNLEEFVAIDGTNPVRPAMKGAYWQPGRNFCRAAQTAHDRFYNGAETGFRCCADAR